MGVSGAGVGCAGEAEGLFGGCGCEGWGSEEAGKDVWGFVASVRGGGGLLRDMNLDHKTWTWTLLAILEQEREQSCDDLKGGLPFILEVPVLLLATICCPDWKAPSAPNLDQRGAVLS